MVEISTDLRRYNPSDFDDFALTIDDASLEEAAGEIDVAAVEAALEGKPNEDLLERARREREVLMQLSSSFEQTWNRQRSFPSQSEYDMSIARQCVNAGMDDAVITFLLVQHREEGGEKAKRPNYYKRTLAKARSSNGTVPDAVTGAVCSDPVEPDVPCDGQRFDPDLADEQLPDDDAVYKPFPVEALPDPLRSFIREAASAIGCDPAFVALPVLACVAAAIGNTRRIQLKPGWSEPPVLWTGIVGESGSSKTPAMKAATRPVMELQGKLLREFEKESAEYEVKQEKYERTLAKWKKEGKSDDPPEKPERPIAKRLVCSDTTVEALAPLLRDQPRGLLLSRDELSGWITSFDQYKGKQGADSAHWLSMHHAGEIIVDRKGDKGHPIYVRHAATSITGGIQPSILAGVCGREHFENGLVARVLFAYPPRRKKRWSKDCISERMESAYGLLLEALYALEFDNDDEGQPIPRLLRLSPRAEAVWERFYNEHANEQVELQGDLAAAWSKLEGYAARLALLVHCVRCATADETIANPDLVDEKSIAAGVLLARWFAREARRVYDEVSSTAEERERRRLIELIRCRGGAITVRGLSKASRQYRGGTRARDALDALVRDKLACCKQVPPGSEGGRPTARYRLVPVNHEGPGDKTPPDDSGNGFRFRHHPTASEPEGADLPDECYQGDEPPKGDEGGEQTASSGVRTGEGEGASDSSAEDPACGQEEEADVLTSSDPDSPSSEGHAQGVPVGSPIQVEEKGRCVHTSSDSRPSSSEDCSQGTSVENPACANEGEVHASQDSPDQSPPGPSPPPPSEENCTQAVTEPKPLGGTEKGGFVTGGPGMPGDSAPSRPVEGGAR